LDVGLYRLDRPKIKSRLEGGNMKIRLMAALAATCVLVGAAEACPNCKSDHIFGRPVVVGNGMAFSWVRLDKETNKPAAVGVTLTETALQGLPTELEDDMEAMEMRLELPQGVEGIPFDHISLDWIPKGHIPIGIYDVPHFDIHFYLLDYATRQGITAKDADIEVCRKPLPDGFMAPGYILPPETEIPMMGSHWIDPTSPEFNGSPFASTFLYGSYNGQLAFLEPMVALSFLQTKPDQTWDLKVPTKFEKAGYYPSQYRVSYNADRKEYNISLEGLKFYEATPVQR
jgi:hypothetical protein